MHIPDGFVSPGVNALTAVISAGACGLALARAKKSLPEREVPLLGVCAAFIFSAQMLNFPVALGTSGHFLGALLAAVLLGPLNACLVMAVVLVTQCFLFQDGGLTALGSNFFNMGIVGGLAGYSIFRMARWVLPRSRTGLLAAAMMAAWCSVVLSAAACALELSVSGTMPLDKVLPAMIGIHALTGIGEALITATILSTVLGVRPDLVREYAPAAMLPEAA